VLAQELGAGGLIVGGGGADIDVAVRLADACQLRHFPQVDQHAWLEELLAHQQDQGCAASEELAVLRIFAGKFEGFV